MGDVFTQNNLQRGFADRAQRVAFWACFIGAFMNAFMFSMYALNDRITAYLVTNALFYMIPLCLICYSSFYNRHFRLSLELGVATIYLYMWATTFYDASTGNGSILSYPILLFIPYFIFIISRFQLLIVYAITHTVLIYGYGTTYMAEVFGFDASHVDTTLLSIILSVMSGSVLMVFAIAAYSREKTDARLLNLIREKERLAQEDPLTGLKNRRAFIKYVDKLWDQPASFAVVFFDLDRFKPINDEYGHTIGDEVLRTIGERVSAIPETHLISRFGGDEFALLLDLGTDEEATRAAVETLYQAVTAPIKVGKSTVSVGASFGYAYAHSHAKTVGELIDAAETAMRRCKANGDAVAMYSPETDDATLATYVVQETFRKALKSGQIRPALQPIISGKTREIVGYELLARWTNSGLARDPSPMEFVPIAERLGLLNELLWSTLDMALAHLNNRSNFLAINVSPSQLSSSNFVSDLARLTKRHGFPLSQIEIEITEHVAFRNLSENIRVLTEARALGCRIVLDDFGAGYSSLSLLEELPLDKVKLDKSLQRSENKRGVLQATIALTTRLGFECCVEGIESAEAADFAAHEGCCQMQGYFFGYPTLVGDASSDFKIAS